MHRLAAAPLAQAKPNTSKVWLAVHNWTGFSGGLLRGGLTGKLTVEQCDIVYHTLKEQDQCIHAQAGCCLTCTS